MKTAFFEFSFRDLRTALNTTNTLRGAIRKMFYDETCMYLSEELLQSFHVQIATMLMYKIMPRGNVLINPFSNKEGMCEQMIAEKIKKVELEGHLWITAKVEVPDNFPKTKFEAASTTIASDARIQKIVRVSEILRMMNDEYATKYVCHAICNLICADVPMTEDNRFDHNTAYYPTAYQSMNSAFASTARQLSFQVMGQMEEGVIGSNQTPEVYSSGFITGIDRKAALSYMLTQDPYAVIQIDIWVPEFMAGRFSE